MKNYLAIILSISVTVPINSVLAENFLRCFRLAALNEGLSLPARNDHDEILSWVEIEYFDNDLTLPQIKAAQQRVREMKDYLDENEIQYQEIGKSRAILLGGFFENKLGKTFYSLYKKDVRVLYHGIYESRNSDQAAIFKESLDLLILNRDTIKADKANRTILHELVHYAKQKNLMKAGDNKFNLNFVSMPANSSRFKKRPIRLFDYLKDKEFQQKKIFQYVNYEDVLNWQREITISGEELIAYPKELRILLGLTNQKVLKQQKIDFQTINLIGEYLINTQAVQHILNKNSKIALKEINRSLKKKPFPLSDLRKKLDVRIGKLSGERVYRAMFDLHYHIEPELQWVDFYVIKDKTNYDLISEYYSNRSQANVLKLLNVFKMKLEKMVNDTENLQIAIDEFIPVYIEYYVKQDPLLLNGLIAEANKMLRSIEEL